VKLTDEELDFVTKRQKFARTWPMVGTVLITILLGFTGWMWLTRPLMINPWAVFDAVYANQIADSTLAAMAAMLSIVMLTCIFTLFSCLMLFFAAFSNEKKLTDIIHRITDQNS
jgi:hypothetical protein